MGNIFFRYTGITEMGQDDFDAACDQRHGTHYATMKPQTEGQAHGWLTSLRGNLYPDYRLWQNAINKLRNASHDAQPAGK